LRVLIETLGKSGPATREQAFALPWVLHIVTDLHQPLHSVSRFRRVSGRPESDKGGNLCFVTGAPNLHVLWDDLLGHSVDEGSIARLAASLEDHQPEPRKLDLNPEQWTSEGVRLAESVAYHFTGDCADKTHPAAIPNGYMAAARQVVIERAGTGAYRLAALLNERLSK